jgi:predicted dehydrogenase
MADKPWIIDHADFPKLEALFRDADLRDVFAWDVLTERFEVTNWLQRELVRDAELFGAWKTSTPEEPALTLSSVHYLKKTVSGLPLVRPWWWFDPAISGESMADVGTHLADLALGLVAPEQPVDYRTQIQVLAADRSPLMLSEDQFRELTGLPEYPPELEDRLTDGELPYAANNSVTFALRGVHVRLRTAWEYEAKAGGDTHQSEARGTKATVSIRQQPGAMPEVFVAATDPAGHADMIEALRERCDSLQRDFPTLGVTDRGTEAHVRIPDNWRTGHEEHFAMVMDEFVRYFHTPRAIPAWEKPNALARYYITTKAVEMAREGSIPDTELR